MLLQKIMEETRLAKDFYVLKQKRVPNFCWQLYFCRFDVATDGLHFQRSYPIEARHPQIEKLGLYDSFYASFCLPLLYAFSLVCFGFTSP